MSPIQSRARYMRLLKWMQFKREVREHLWVAAPVALLVVSSAMAYHAGKAHGQERMLKVLVPHLCVPAEVPAPDDPTRT